MQVGYEAEDGTFKIESRDVLGNVKGTYGYIDENGDIKRVSYAANNATGIKMQPVQETAASSSTSTSASVEEVVHIPRQNRTQFTLAATTRRPAALAYLTSTANPTRTSVIQSIPKRRILYPTSTERTTYTNLRSTEAGQTAHSEPTTTVVYATSVSTPKPYTLIRPTSVPQYSSKNSEQIARPDKLEIDQVSQVYNNNNNKEATKLTLKEHDKKTLRGNNLRRQLHQDNNEDEAFEAQQQVIYSQSAGEDATHVYGGGGGGGIRPLFTTTSSPRIPAAVIAARQRAAHLHSVLSGSMPSTTTERVYVKPPRRPEVKLTEEETTESNPDSDNNYLTQNPNPVVQIPANRDITETAGDERRAYRQRPIVQIDPVYRPRDGPRYLPQAAQQGGSQRTAFRIPLAIPQQVRPDEGQYIRETTPGMNRGPPFPYGSEPTEDEAPNPNAIPPIAYRGPRRFPPSAAPQPQAYADISYTPEQQQLQPQVSQQPQQLGGFQQPQQQQSSYLTPFGFNPYRQQSYPSQYYDNPDRPLTARDFERLLQLLLLRHQLNQQRFGGYGNQGNPFFPGGPNALNPAFNPSPYGYQQIPRPPFYGGYDRNYQNPNYSPSTNLRQFAEQGNAYQATNALGSDEQTGNLYAGQSQGLIPRRRQFRGFNAVTPIYPTEQEFGASNNIVPPPSYLPSEVREDLLYRMLMLAIQSEQQLLQSPSEPISDIKATTDSPTTTTTELNKFRKPVRSVQILGEE